MSALVPVWIIGGPFIGLLFLAFAFKGPSAMGGNAPRLSPRDTHGLRDPSAPITDPMAPGGSRRLV